MRVSGYLATPEPPGYTTQHAGSGFMDSGTPGPVSEPDMAVGLSSRQPLISLRARCLCVCGRAVRPTLILRLELGRLQMYVSGFTSANNTRGV